MDFGQDMYMWFRDMMQKSGKLWVQRLRIFSGFSAGRKGQQDLKMRQIILKVLLFV